jgi:hypothetical protein
MFEGCVYVQDLTITDPRQLGVLSLLYEHISLPHAYDHDSESEPIMRMSFENERYREIERKRYSEWKQENRELFDANVLNILPPPISVADLPNDIEQRLCRAIGPTKLRLNTTDVLDGRIAIAMHAVFANPSFPEFTLAPPNSTATEDLQRALAADAISWRIPLLPEIKPEQILEIRERTKPFREGFLLYLATLADDVEARMRKDGLDNVSAAKKAFERNIQPEVEEFIRRRLPEQVAWWAKLLNGIAKGSGQVIETVATPFRFRNFPKIAETLTDLVQNVAERVSESRSNKRHAFQFIRKLKV